MVYVYIHMYVYIMSIWRRGSRGEGTRIPWGTVESVAGSTSSMVEKQVTSFLIVAARGLRVLNPKPHWYISGPKTQQDIRRKELQGEGIIWEP